MCLRMQAQHQVAGRVRCCRASLGAMIQLSGAKSSVLQKFTQELVWEQMRVRTCDLVAARRCRRRAAVILALVLPCRSCSASCRALLGRLPLQELLLPLDIGPLMLPAAAVYMCFVTREAIL